MTAKCTKRLHHVAYLGKGKSLLMFNISGDMDKFPTRCD